MVWDSNFVKRKKIKKWQYKTKSATQYLYWLPKSIKKKISSKWFKMYLPILKINNSNLRISGACEHTWVVKRNCFKKRYWDSNPSPIQLRPIIHFLRSAVASDTKLSRTPENEKLADKRCGDGHRLTEQWEIPGFTFFILISPSIFF
jgi:hypothetical protein